MAGLTATMLAQEFDSGVNSMDKELMWLDSVGDTDGECVCVCVCVW